MASQIVVQSGLTSPFSRISSNSEIFSSGTMLALNLTSGGSSFPDLDLETGEWCQRRADDGCGGRLRQHSDNSG